MVNKRNIKYSTMSDSELQSSLLDFRKEQLNLRFQKVNGQLSNTSRFKELRRDTARIKTEQTKRLNNRGVR